MPDDRGVYDEDKWRGFDWVEENATGWIAFDLDGSHEDALLLEWRTSLGKGSEEVKLAVKVQITHKMSSVSWLFAQTLYACGWSAETVM